MERTYPPNLRTGPVRLQKCAPGPKECQELSSQIATKTSLARTLGAAAQMGRAWRVSQGLSLRAFATVATQRRGRIVSLTLQRPQARPTSILTQGRRRYKEGVQQTSVPRLSWRALPLLDAENIGEPVPLLLVRRIVKHLPENCLRLPFGFVLLKKHGSVT